MSEQSIWIICMTMFLIALVASLAAYVTGKQVGANYATEYFEKRREEMWLRDFEDKAKEEITKSLVTRNPHVIQTITHVLQELLKYMQNIKSAKRS